jgi:hypothetical protein
MKKDKYIDHRYEHPFKQSVYVPIKQRHIIEQAKTLGTCLGGLSLNEVVVAGLELFIDANIGEYNDRYDDHE